MPPPRSPSIHPSPGTAGDFTCRMAPPADQLRLCAKLIDQDTGERLLWGEEDFWALTGQSSDGENMNPQGISGSPNPGGHWCVDTWELEGLMRKLSCDDIHIHCAATDMCEVLKQYRDPESIRGHNGQPPNLLTSDNQIQTRDLPTGTGVAEECLERLCKLEYDSCIAEHIGERAHGANDSPRRGMALVAADDSAPGEPRFQGSNKSPAQLSSGLPGRARLSSAAAEMALASIGPDDDDSPPTPSAPDATLRDVPVYPSDDGSGQRYLSHEEARAPPWHLPTTLTGMFPS